MTDETLNRYFKQHENLYQTLAHCKSVPEIILKLNIYGKCWGHQDWSFLFATIIHGMSHNEFFPNAGIDCVLLDDILDAIDNSTQLDSILTNKKILLSIIHICNSKSIISNSIKQKLYTMLAHAFKKFPSMWNIAWMYAKFKDPTTKRWLKYHRLKNSLAASRSLPPGDAYYDSKQYYNDFIKQYFI